MSDRYHVEGSQTAYQPGSDDRVLANRLGIIVPEEMAEAELILLEKLYNAILLQDFPDRALTVADLKTWHRRWLGNIYDWAGEERSVNLSKDEFPFAAAGQIPKLLADFQRLCLDRFTPCHNLDDESIIDAIATTHVEFILVHPFREGNGRLSRLLADVMATQAGFGPLDYSAWDADKEAYFAAIQAGMNRNYDPMRRKIQSALEGNADL